MSNWEHTCQEQLARLEKTAVLADKLATLCSKAQAHLTPDIINSLREERPHLDRQLERLRANRFEVAVIGLEKAGKSALLNAWLGQEILPSADERCTYTSTEIWSAPTEDDQELCIDYFSRQEIDARFQDKQEEMKKFIPGSRDYDDLAQDIDETKFFMDSGEIYEYAKQGKTKRGFRDISEISDDLQQAVFKNRAQARAIKRIQLKTTRLRNDRDIVFHDVPGFDSPVAMHKNQAEQKLSSCDAIIYAKKIENPNINSPEKNMLQVADAEDPHVKVADKVFVVLTKVDMARNADEYSKWIGMHREQWKGVPDQRIVAVCAAAHLAALGTGSAETNQNGKQSIENLAKLNIDNGIDSLKQAVAAYIDHERADVLRKRCDALVSGYKNQAQLLLDKLAPIYNQSIENGADEEDLYGPDFGRWWGSEWTKIKQDFQSWYLANIELREGADGTAGEHAKLTELRDAYNSKVENLFAELDSAKRSVMELTYKDAIKLVPVPAHGNKAIRDRLHAEIQQILQQQLPDSLTGSLKAITDEIVGKAKQSLFDIEEVDSILLEERSLNEQKIYHGFKTLFLRFGRIAVDVFVALPLHERPRLLQEYEPEICTLEAFYSGPNKEMKGNLTDYLRMGSWVIKTASELGIAPPIIGKGIKGAEKIGAKAGSIADLIGSGQQNTRSSGQHWNPFDEASTQTGIHEPKNFEAVVKEIEADLTALQDYLKNSVFQAAGFIPYSRQELQRIRERFIQLEERERRWDHIVRREAKRQNSKIPFKIADRMQDFRLRREIALEIKESKNVFEQLH